MHRHAVSIATIRVFIIHTETYYSLNNNHFPTVCRLSPLYYNLVVYCLLYQASQLSQFQAKSQGLTEKTENLTPF